VSFAPGATDVLLDTDGPGKITHIWLTAASFPKNKFLLCDLALRIYWENSPVPSVEVPVGDFFALGHGKLYTLQSVPVAVGINPCALNCYWPMPFVKHARIEIYNNGLRSVHRLYYNLAVGGAIARWIVFSIPPVPFFRPDGSMIRMAMLS
jgi:hypothetical protein